VPERPAKRGRPARIYRVDPVRPPAVEPTDDVRTPSPPLPDVEDTRPPSPPSGSKLSPPRIAVFTVKDVGVDILSPSPVFRGRGRARTGPPQKFSNIDYEAQGYVLKDEIQLALLQEWFDNLVGLLYDGSLYLEL
jgi:hypothetical protein